MVKIKPEMETNRERLEAKTEAKAEANLWKTKAQVSTNQEKMKVSEEEIIVKMGANEAKMDAWLE
jgi:hypothetical protein